jgi:hypothetical protein
MVKIEYVQTSFADKTLAVIGQVDELLSEYAAAGYDLTARQIYYQFVGRKLFGPDRRFKRVGSRWVRHPKGTTNCDTNYKWLKAIISKARLAGLLGWDMIVDRTRKLEQASHWSTPEAIVAACAEQYRLDTRADQDAYIEVWVEKEALIDVLARTCDPLDVAYFACRGYVSQSAMWAAAQRLDRRCGHGCPAVILYLGDHDPSGLDMPRDIQDRLDLMTDGSFDVEVLRLGLTMEQVEAHNVAPDPAKVSDSRYDAYVADYGEESYELDALDPRTIAGLIGDGVRSYTQEPRRRQAIGRQQQHRRQLRAVAGAWGDIIEEYGNG